MNKKIIISMLGILLIVFMSFLVSATSSIPFTLMGEKAKCSVYPTVEKSFPNGGDINLNYPNCLIDFYRVEPSGSHTFLAEYKEKYVTLKPYSTSYWAEMYCGCDFDLLDNPIDDGVPGIIEKCPSGYSKVGGSCIPNEDTRIDNLKRECFSRGGLWDGSQCISIVPADSSNSTKIMIYVGIVVLIFVLLKYVFKVI